MHPLETLSKELLATSDLYDHEIDSLMFVTDLQIQINKDLETFSIVKEIVCLRKKVMADYESSSSPKDQSIVSYLKDQLRRLEQLNDVLSKRICQNRSRIEILKCNLSQ